MQLTRESDNRQLPIRPIGITPLGNFYSPKARVFAVAILPRLERSERLIPGVVTIDPVRIGPFLEPGVGARIQLDTRCSRLAGRFKAAECGRDAVAINA